MIRIGVCLLFWGFSLFAHGRARTIETYGDSLTAGFLSHTSVLNAPPISYINQLLSDMLMFKLTQNAKYITPYHHPELAWPAAVAKTWAAAEGVSFELDNYAISGSRTWDLIDQVKSESLGKKDPHALGFFFIGHNDLCKNHESPSQIAAGYVHEYEKALELWDSQHENTLGYLLPVGDIAQVYQVLNGVVWHQGSDGTYRCEDSWKKYFPYCREYAKMQEEGKLEQHLAPRIDAMNAALAQLAERWDKKSTRNNRYRYLTNMTQIPYEKGFFAVDCFHLSVAGQNKLAQVITDQIPASEVSAWIYSALGN